MPKAVVTGLGAVTCLGRTAPETFAGLLAGRSGLRRLTVFHSPRFADVPVGEVEGTLSEAPGATESRTERLALLAAQEALGQAGLSAAAARDAGPAWGVVAGTTVAGMLASEEYFRQAWSGKKPRASLIRRHLGASVSRTLAQVFNIQGFHTTLSTACSSGVNAVAMAAELVEQGEAQVVLAVGADSLSAMTVNGFHSLLIADPAGSRPFDAARRGLSLGEGAGALVVESEAHARARGAAVLARVLGAGNTCDAHHATAPHPEGVGAEAAMRQALARAGLEPAAVGYVNAHGTGTPDNDAAEGKALARVFLNHLPHVSSTKGATGHTLGAAGAIESVVSVLALMQEQLPPNTGCVEPDPALAFTPLRAPLRARVDAVMNNSFGFGGNNSSIIFGRA
jgi:3-oxoacyl-[acyl-carrier-protein] synthase II